MCKCKEKILATYYIFKMKKKEKEETLELYTDTESHVDNSSIFFFSNNICFELKGGFCFSFFFVYFIYFFFI